MHNAMCLFLVGDKLRRRLIPDPAWDRRAVGWASDPPRTQLAADTSTKTALLDTSAFFSCLSISSFALFFLFFFFFCWQRVKPETSHFHHFLDLHSYFKYVFSRFYPPRRKAGGFLMSHPLSGISGLSVWFHFSISPLLFFCLVLSLFLFYPFQPLAHSPDPFYTKLPFPER